MSFSGERREAVYAWLRWTPSSSALLYVPLEDVGKRERVIGEPDFVPLSLGMLGVVSGGLEVAESYESAVRRELLEERGVASDATITNTLPTTVVEQFREEGPVTFSAHGHVIYVDSLLQASLLQVAPAIEIPDSGLMRYLEEYRNRLRPFVYQVGTELVKSGMIYRL